MLNKELLLVSKRSYSLVYRCGAHKDIDYGYEASKFGQVLYDDVEANNRVELAKLQAELKCCCEKQELREQIVLGKVNELALTTQAKFGCLDGTIAGMMGTLNNITKTIVPASAICPAPMPLHNSWVAPTTTTTPTA